MGKGEDPNEHDGRQVANNNKSKDPCTPDSLIMRPETVTRHAHILMIGYAIPPDRRAPLTSHIPVPPCAA
jgi:hypothetical protein